MKSYKFYIYGKRKEGKFCRLIFTIEKEQEHFLKAELKNSFTSQIFNSYFAASKFIKDEKLKLIDEFMTIL
jgi:hypothetical protein